MRELSRLMDCPPKARKHKITAKPPNKHHAKPPEQPDAIPGTGQRQVGLPGDNPYDDAVANRGFSYSAAKQREEVRLLDEKIKQAKIDTETAQITLERERLAVQEARGALISKSEYLAKQEAIVSTLKELVRLVVSECEVLLPADIRDASVEMIERKSDAAFVAIAQAVIKGKPRDAVIHAMNDAFRDSDA